MPADSLPTELGGNLKVDHGAWLRYCFKSMTNRVGDLCDISTGPNPLFPPSTTTANDDYTEDISQAGPSDDERGGEEEEEEEDEDELEEIEEPVAIKVESVVHRLVCFVTFIHSLLLLLYSLALAFNRYHCDRYSY